MCTRRLGWSRCSRLRNCCFMGAHSLAVYQLIVFTNIQTWIQTKNLLLCTLCYTSKNCGSYGVEAIKRGRERQPENVPGQVESMAAPKKPNKKFLSHIYPDWPERPNIHETIKASWVPIVDKSHNSHHRRWCTFFERAYWKHGNDFKCKHYAMQASTPLHKSQLVICFTESLRDSSTN